MSQLAAYHDAFSDYSLLAKTAARFGYIPDMSTDNGELTRVIDGKPHATVRAFGNGESVLLAHPLHGGWKIERVLIISADGSNRNSLFVADKEPTAELATVHDLPFGHWGLVYETARDRVRNWQRLKRRGLSFLIGGADVAEREEIPTWPNISGLRVNYARHLLFYGWHGTEFWT
jgi:hypothetical protein